MTEIAPRLAKRSRRRFILLCGFDRCNGVIGRLTPQWLRESPFITPPDRLPGEALALRTLIEEQAPLGARCPVLFVLPEGFARNGGSQIWSITRRGRLRHVAARAGRLPRTATHRQRPRFRGSPLYATAPPLPAEVRCSECWRTNITTLKGLTPLLGAISDAWSGDIAGRAGDFVAKPVNGGVGQATAGSRLHPEQLRGHEQTKRGSDPTTTALSDSKRGMFSRTHMSETIFTTPQSDTFVEVGLTGREIRPEDFFLLLPARPYMVGEPDSELLDMIAE